jgi:hypothetical protein
MWNYRNEVFALPEDFNPSKPVYVGFVYMITNNLNGKKYIGKKFFVSIKRKQVKGKGKRYKAVSDWEKYYGSSERFSADIQEHGKENFSRVILHLCTTKSECGYLEAREQFLRDAIISDDYYNDWIQCKVRRAHLNKHKEALIEKINVAF